MAISLKKNSGIKLTKDDEGLKQIILGLGWDPSTGYATIKRPVKKKSLFGFGKETLEIIEEKVRIGDIDLDSTILAFKDRRLVGECSYRRNMSPYARHSGDDTTGGSNKKGDDEKIELFLSKIGDFADTFYLVLNVFGAQQRGQTLDMVNNAYVKVYDDEKKEIAFFNLTDNYEDMTGCVVGKVVRGADGWEFIALGNGVKTRGIDDLIKIVNRH